MPRLLVMTDADAVHHLLSPRKKAQAPAVNIEHPCEGERLVIRRFPFRLDDNFAQQSSLLSPS
jgi:hypothetical protein